MKRFCACLFVCCAVSVAAFAADPSRHVVIISLDGCTPALFQDPYARNLRSLWTNGSFTWHAQTVSPSVTLVAHASMLSGLLPAKHHIDWNDYQPAKGTIAVPTLFQLAHQAGLQTAFIASKRKFWHLDPPDSATVSAYPHSAVEETGVDPRNPYADPKPPFDTVRAVRHCFGEVTPSLCFIHFAQPDLTGHAQGWDSEEILYAVRQVDQQIGTLLAYWKRTGFLDNTVILLTADHGGHQKTHGTADPSDMTIPWVAWGSHIRTNHPIESPVSICDTAATAAFILKLTIPRNWDGEIVTEIFR